MTRQKITLIIFEGFNDLQLFKSFLMIKAEYKDATNGNINIIEQFRKAYKINPGGTRIDVLEHRKNQEKVILISVGGKQHFSDLVDSIVKASKVLVEKMGISKIILVGDKDGQKIIEGAKNKINNTNSNIITGIVVYDEDLEDLILKILEVVNSRISQKDNEVLKCMFGLLTIAYFNENKKTFKKRKTSAMHTILGPRCWGHLFEELFHKLSEKDVKKIKELTRIKELLEK